MSKTLIFTATYNEKDNIRKLIEKLGQAGSFDPRESTKK